MRMWIQVLALFVSFTLPSSLETRGAEHHTYNPFVSEFLKICGYIGISGEPFYKSTALSLATLFSGLTIEVRAKDEYIFCSLFGSYNSNVSRNGEEQSPALGSVWLEDASSIGVSFDRWVEEFQVSAKLQPNTNCLTSPDELDVVTQLLYSRAVSVGETKRVIVVEIKRILDSYLEPNRGYSDVLFAWSTNSPAECSQ